MQIAVTVTVVNAILLLRLKINKEYFFKKKIITNGFQISIM